jgi:release factor glutamine methyltransferase
LRAAGCVFAEDEAQLLIDAARTPVELVALVDQRVGGLPLEQVLGWAEFCGLRIIVEPGVFVPRQRTAFLVQQAVALVSSGSTVVDLCCGSGAVGAALAAAVGDIELHAVDISPPAVRCARRNAPGAQVYLGDLYAPLPPRLRGRVELLIANAPYVPTSALGLLPPEARLYEPQVTLDGGADGLDIHRRIASSALDWLTFDGHLIIEVGAGQVPSAVELFALSGLTARTVVDNELDTVVVVGSSR